VRGQISGLTALGQHPSSATVPNTPKSILLVTATTQNMKLSTREHLYEFFGTFFYYAAVAVLIFGFDFLREFFFGDL